jgi:hypothetical protein
MDLSDFCKSISSMVINNIEGPQWMDEFYTPKFIENLIITMLDDKGLLSSSSYRDTIPSAYYDLEIFPYYPSGHHITLKKPLINFKNWILILQRSIIKYFLLNSTRITWLHGSSPSKPLTTVNSSYKNQQKYGGSWYLTIPSNNMGNNSLDSIFEDKPSETLKRLAIGWVDIEPRKSFDLNFEPPSLYWNINHSQPIFHAHKNVWFFELPNSKRKHSFLNWSKSPI